MNNNPHNIEQSSLKIERLQPRGVGENKTVLHGKFNITYEESGLLVTGADVLSHVILVATRTANYQSVTPFKDVVIFEDDVTETGSGCTGVFNIDLFKKILFDGEGDYYILCSIGSVTSNILKVTL